MSLPLTKDELSKIPIVTITKKQVEASLGCSVCEQDFKVEEHVRKLPCKHLFHEKCIVKRLEWYGWCPFCRRDPRKDESPNNGETPLCSFAQIMLDPNVNIEAQRGTLMYDMDMQLASKGYIDDETNKKFWGPILNGPNDDNSVLTYSDDETIAPIDFDADYDSEFFDSFKEILLDDNRRTWSKYTDQSD